MQIGQFYREIQPKQRLEPILPEGNVKLDR